MIASILSWWHWVDDRQKRWMRRQSRDEHRTCSRGRAAAIRRGAGLSTDNLWMQRGVTPDYPVPLTLPFALFTIHPFTAGTFSQRPVRPERSTASQTFCVSSASRKVGLAGLLLREAFEEVGDLVDEGVLVADLQAGHPPLAHVGMVAVGDVDRCASRGRAFVAVVEVLQAMQVVQVPVDRGVLAVDLERVERLVAAGVARRFEQRRASRC